MTPLQKRLAELKAMAVREVDWTHYGEYARALLALLPVVEAADDYHHVRNKWGDVIDALKRCERALIKTETKETKT